MAFRRTLLASEWDKSFDLENAYWRVHKINIIRTLEGENDSDNPSMEDDVRTKFYDARVVLTIYQGSPNMQGKPVASGSYEVRLDTLTSQEGDDLIAKSYNYLASHSDFVDAQSV